MVGDNKNNVIALDAMGGDKAPEEVIHGAELLLQDPQYQNTYFHIFGNEDTVKEIIEKCPNLKQKHTFFNTRNEVSAHEKPSNALRNCKESSMYRSILALKDKTVDAVVSAGNTGALMAISTILLRTLPQIHRPAIIAVLPTVKGKTVMLDLGANVDADATNLFQFAIMGHAFAKVTLGISNPKIAILNIGSEELKGKDSIKLAHSMLKESNLPINFQGYIEGNEIFDGVADVIVTDGFTGNVVLKTISGNVKIYSYFLKKAFTYNFIAKLKYFISKSVLKMFAQSLDHRNYNGAMFIGINGIVVKSHGSMDRIGICNAIKAACTLSKEQINQKIALELKESNALDFDLE
jgi:glycerol-3-phosphate acyltransferase PlsX